MSTVNLEKTVRKNACHLYQRVPIVPKKNTYPDGAFYVCADCGHEWSVHAKPAPRDGSGVRVVRDANGNVLVNGDSVVLVKDLRVKGSSITLKMGTRVKSINLVDADHEVDCRIDMCNFMLKARFLKKA